MKNTFKPFVPFAKEDYDEIEKMIVEILSRYPKKTFDAFLGELIEKFKSKEKISYSILGNKILEYKQIVSDPDTIIFIKSCFNELITFLNSDEFKEELKQEFKGEFLDNDLIISCRLVARQKSFIDLFKKCILFMKKGEDLSKIHDTIGLRATIDVNCSQKMENRILCFMTLSIFDFFIRNGFLPVLAEPILDTGFRKEDFPNIYLPTKEEHDACLPEMLWPYLKDYIFNPKSNGYQSLHLVLMFLFLFLEIQIRTQDMDNLAESGKACHSGHKNVRYEYVKTFLSSLALTEINVLNFSEHADNIGLVHSKSLLCKDFTLYLGKF